MEPILARSAECVDGSSIADIRLQVVGGSWLAERAHFTCELPQLFKDGEVMPVVDWPTEPAKLKGIELGGAPDHV